MRRYVFFSAAIVFLAGCERHPDAGARLGSDTSANATVSLCKGVNCSSSNACLKSACDKDTGACVETPVGDGTACNDGQACTLVDACQSGVCVGTESTCGMAVQFSPATPRTGDDITASLDPGPDPSLSVAWAWTCAKKGVTAETTPYTSAVLPFVATDRGDKWMATATVSDATGHAQTAKGTVTIADTPPSITAVTLTPASPARTDTLVCAYTGWSDADSDPPHVTTAWFQQAATGRVLLTGTALKRSASDLSVGESVFCEVTPRDNEGPGAPVDAPAVTIVDQAPVLAGATIRAVAVAGELDTFACSAKGAKDPDGDPLITSYAWLDNGALLPGSIGATLTSGYALGDSVSCQLAVSDGMLSATATSRSLVVRATRPSAPTVGTVTVSGQSACGAWTCAASNIVDPSGGQPTLNYQWLLDNEVVANATSSTLPSGLVAGGESVVCEVSATDGGETGPETQSAAVIAIDNPPVISSVSLPATAHRADTVQCAVVATDDCTADLSYSYAWTVDGKLVSGATAQSFPAGALSPGDLLTCAASVNDGANTTTATSNPATILDYPPAIASATISTPDARPTRLSTFTCAATGASDADGDALVTTFAWFVNGNQVAGAAGNTLANAFVKGQLVSCSATVSDGYATATATSSSIAILPALPAVASALVSGQSACGAFTCTASGVADADGDSVSLQYAWSINGNVLAGATQSSLPTGSVSGGQSVQCTVTPSAGATLGAPVTSPAVIAVDNPPVIASVSIPSAGTRADTLTCAVSASDDCTQPLSISYAWLVDGVAASSTASTFALSSTHPGDSIACSASVSDGFNSAVVATSNTATVADRPPQISTVQLTSPDARITRLSTLTCEVSASDPDGDSLTTSYAWSVNGAQVGGATGATLASGFAKGQLVSCTATVSDGYASASFPSTSVLILDATPVIGSATVSGEGACDVWTCAASGVVDPDGDAVTLHYRWLVGGTEATGANESTFTPGQPAAGQSIACAVRGDDGTYENGSLLLGPETQSQPDTAVDEPPAIASVTLPASVHLWTTPLTCAVSASDDCNANLSIAYTWQIDGQTVPGATAATFLDPGALGPSDTVTCTATVSDGTNLTSLTSNPTSLSDQPPTVQGAAIATADSLPPTRLSTLVCSPIGASDPDGDSLSFAYAWTVNGAAAGSGATLAGAFVRGDLVACSLSVSDGEEAVSASQTIAIGDAPPIVGTVTVSGQSACGVFTCSASNVLDADGDPLSLHYRWFVDGTAVAGAAGNTYQSSSLAGGQSIACAASANDGLVTGPEALSPATTATLLPPVITSVSLPAAAHDFDGPFTCNVTLADSCGPPPDITYTFYVDDSPYTVADYWTSLADATSPNPVFYDPQGFDDFAANFDMLSCSATATNSGGSSATVTSNEMLFADQPPSNTQATITTNDGQPPNTQNILQCNSTASDPDGDPLQLVWYWFVNGQGLSVNTQTIAAAAGGYKKGDSVACALLSIDPADERNQQTSPAVVIGDPPPVIPSASIGGSSACGAAYCDAAGVSGGLHYRWLLNGNVIANQTSQSIPWSSMTLNTGDALTCGVRGDNGLTGSNLQLGAETISSAYVFNKTAQPTMPTSVPSFVGAGTPSITCGYTLPEGCGAPLQTYFVWFINGEQVYGGALTYPTSNLNLGDTYSCQVFVLETNNSIVGTSSTGVYGDNLPVIGAVTMSTTDAIPRAGTTFTCAASGVSDPDEGDSVTVSYNWTVNGNLVSSGPTSTPGSYRRGDVVHCTALASDGKATSRLDSTSVTIHSTPPVITSVAVAGNDGVYDVCQQMTCNVQRSDVDGDGITLHYDWFVDGQDLGSDNDTLPSNALGVTHAGAHVACSAYGDDGTVENGVQLFSNTLMSSTVTAIDQPPSVTGVSIGSFAHPGATISCTANVSDDCTSTPEVTYAWTRNGSPIAGAASSTLFTSGFTPGDTIVCTVSASDTHQTTTRSSRTLGITDSQPTIASASLTVNGPTALKSSILTCAAGAEADADGDPLTTTYAWQVDSVQIPGATSSTFSGGFSHGQRVNCVATVSDPWSSAFVASNSVTIVNSPPTIASASLTVNGPAAIKSSILTCTAVAEADLDGDSLTTSTSWQVNGITVPGATASTFSGGFTHGQTVTCTATVSDGKLSASTVSNGMEVQDTAPTVASASVSGTSYCSAYTCNPSGAQDVDGDALTLHYKWLVNDVDEGLDQPTLPPLAAHLGDHVACAVAANDGQVTGLFVTSPAITAVQQAPSLSSVTLTPPFEAHAGDTLTCSAAYTDACSSSDGIVYEFDVNGAARQSAPGATFSTSGLNVGDNVTCKASVTDGSQTGTADSNAVSIITDTWTLTANVAGGLAGQSVAVVDDLNHDGLRELAIGAPNTTTFVGDSRAGAIYLVNGRKNTVSTKLSDIAASIGGSYLAGDHGSFNLKTMACDTHTGSGCPTATNVDADIWAFDTGPDGAGLGWSLAYAGDVDGDGIGDLIAGAPFDQVGNVWAGRTYMLSGTSLLSQPIGDSIFGSHGFTFDGECGRRNALDTAAPTWAPNNGDLAGYKVVPIGDANGDGLGDFAVAAPNSGDSDEGTVYVVFGRSDGQGVVASDIFQRGCNHEQKNAPGLLSGSAGYAAYFANQGENNNAPYRWGRMMAPAGDFNGDGYDDLIITPNSTASPNGTDYLELGGPHPGPRALGAVDPAAQWAITLDDNSKFTSTSSGVTCTSGFFGSFQPAGGGGDVNGDGIDDLAIQAQWCGHGGFLSVLYGRRTAPAGATLGISATLDPTQGFNVIGPEVGWFSDSGTVLVVDDLNGDGYDDIVVAVPTQDSNAGEVLVIFGGPTPIPNLSTAMLRQGIGGFIIEPQNAGEKFGTSITAGDIDGDGLTDLVIGAPYATGTEGQAYAGRAQVVFGRDFTGNVITWKGSPGDDQYTGTAAAESIIGGRGNDVLIGGGGADVIYGGAGDDLIEVDDDSFRRVNGGAGNDTLVLGPNVSGLTLTGQNRRRIREIENLKLQGQTITLSKLGLVAMSNTTHALKIYGAGSVRLQAGDHWKKTGTQADSNGTYNVLTDGQAQLSLATSLSTNIPPTIFDGPLTVPENSPVGTTVATLSGTDPDGSDSLLQWQLLEDDSGAFALDSAGHLQVVNVAPLDFEAQQFPWNLTVSVTDQTGLTAIATYIVSLSDVPEPPVWSALSYHWSAGEAATGVLGNVQAIDPDVGDSVTYSIAADASGMFSIDPASGDVSLIDGKTFDFALAPTYTLILDASDTQGHTVAAPLQIDIIPEDPLTRTAHVDFELRDWSIYQDESSSAFPGFQIPGLDGITSCGENSPDLSYSEPWLARFLDGPETVALPVQFHAKYLGSICTTESFNYDSGTVNATIPYDVTFTYPEQITPGQTFTLSSTATPTYDGAALWGNAPGFSMRVGFKLNDFGIDMEVCSELGTEVCKTIVNQQGVTASTTNSFGLPVQAWKGVPGSDSSKYQFVMPSAVSTSSRGFSINWDDTWFWIASLFNLPSNTGTIDTKVANMPVDFDYVLFTGDMGLKLNADWTFGLDVTGVGALLTLEDGTSIPFALGIPLQVTVPASADKNGDGIVNVSITLQLNSTFHNTWNHTETGGYMWTGGYGRLYAENELGQVEAQRTVGPAFKQGCGLETDLSADEPSDPINCLSTTEMQQFDFSPSGFSVPVIQGGFNVKQ